MINLNEAAVTNIQFFDCTRQIQTGENEHSVLKEYSANIIINERLVIQLSGNCEESHRPTIPTSVECYYNDDKLQDWAFENIDIDSVIELLDREEIENNFGYLSDNGELMS